MKRLKVLGRPTFSREDASPAQLIDEPVSKAENLSQIIDELPGVNNRELF